MSEAREGEGQPRTTRGRRGQTDRSVSGILGNFLGPGQNDDDERQQDRSQQARRASQSARVPEPEARASEAAANVQVAEPATGRAGSATADPAELPESASGARPSARAVEPASGSREREAKELAPERVEPEPEQELEPGLETNPAVTVMQELISRGKVPKHQKGYELPDTHQWALQDIRQHMMRVQKFTAREASASNCVAAALELYYHVLFGEPIER